MSDGMERLLEQYKTEVKKAFGDIPVRVILYGSYARGDYQADSDVDILVLADVSPEEISAYASRIYDLTYDFEESYDREINPVVQSQSVYEYWKNVYPFFMNIEKEGIAV